MPPDPDLAYAARYPALYAPERWDWAGLDMQFTVVAPDDALVTNIHVVGQAADAPGCVVLCYDPSPVFGWFLPGGTREADESIEACVDRELAEEAGAIRTGPLRWIGAHVGTSDRAEPRFPWQPHPRKAWLWCATPVRLGGKPTNPTGAEQVTDVRPVPYAEAGALLGSWYPDLIDLAVSHLAPVRERGGRVPRDV